MLTGVLNLQAFAFQVVDGEGKPADRPGKTIPVKILILTDRHTGLQITSTFTVPEYERFVEHLTERKVILPASVLAQGANGGPKILR
jgi:hypothetical protein